MAKPTLATFAMSASPSEDEIGNIGARAGTVHIGNIENIINIMNIVQRFLKKKFLHDCQNCSVFQNWQANCQIGVKLQRNLKDCT